MRPAVTPEPCAAANSAAESGYDEKMVEHIRMATSLFEGRKVSREEVLEMLADEEKRQLRIGDEEGRDYGAGERSENSS